MGTKTARHLRNNESKESNIGHGGTLDQVMRGRSLGDGTRADVFMSLGCELGEDLVQECSGRGIAIVRWHDGKVTPNLLYTTRKERDNTLETHKGFKYFNKSLHKVVSD